MHARSSNSNKTKNMREQLRTIQSAGIAWPTVIDLLAKYSPDELDERGKNGGFRLITDVAWNADLSIPDLPGGWRSIYAGREEPGAVGSIFLMPNTPWTRKLWNHGQHKVLMDDGMTSDQALRFMVSKERHKTRAIRNIVYLIKRNSADELCNRATQGFSSKDDFDRWCSRYLPSGAYSMERVTTILNVVRDILRPSAHIKAEVAKLMDSMEWAEAKPDEPMVEQPVATEETPKPKKKMSAKKKAKWDRYRERVRGLRKAGRNKPAEEEPMECAAASAIAAVAYEKYGDATYADAGPAVEMPAVEIDDPVVAEIREALNARDAAEEPSTETQED